MPTIVNLPLPYQLTPDTLADATQVMADLNYLATQINANSATPGTVKVTANSTLNSYLASVTTAGTGITLTVLNSGAAETLQIASNLNTITLAQMQAAAVSF